jgi:hypothetical protein
MRAITRGLLAATAALCMGGAALAQQPGKVVAGTLTCVGEGTVGLIVGSQERLSCTFDPAGQGATQRYDGRITKIGLDIGFTTKSTIVWTVLGSSNIVGPGVLAGNYAGVSAEATVALGVGANALLGGSNNSVVLQPLSVQGQTGLNVAVGISGLTLR